VSDDNGGATLLGSRQSKKKTQVVLSNEYASFADVFLEEKAS